MVQLQELLEDLIAEIGLGNSRNTFVWLLGTLLLLVDIYSWMDLFLHGNLANLFHIFDPSRQSFSILFVLQTIIDLINFSKFLIQLCIAVVINYLFLGNPILAIEITIMFVKHEYNKLIVKMIAYLKLRLCLKRNYLIGSIRS
jgi:hypothetical protein